MNVLPASAVGMLNSRRTIHFASQVPGGLRAWWWRGTLSWVLLQCFYITGSALTADFANLVQFDGSNGGNPRAGLVWSRGGQLHGTTTWGGQYGSGTVFRMTPEGTMTTLANLSWSTGTQPEGALFEAKDGSFYGTARQNGLYKSGAIFVVTAEGVLRTLVHFDGQNDLKHPAAGLVQGRDGDFYGTTWADRGAVFKMTAGGNLSKLVGFDGRNGSFPEAELVEARDGILYGTTYQGGKAGFGTVFRLTPSGEMSVLVDFEGPNGRSPKAGLVQGSDGNFYGTTFYGGNSNAGTAFRVTPEGGLSTLFHFSSKDGRQPAAALVQGRDGNFYGTTQLGGALDYGTVFQLTPKGVLTTLHSFDGANGRQPEAPLVVDDAGNLYGTTYRGGQSDRGTIFKITLPAPRDVLPPEVRITRPATVRFITKAPRVVIRGTISGSATPVRLQFRTRRPGPGSFGPWREGALTGSADNRTWSQVMQLPAAGLWRVQVRAFDENGKVSNEATRVIVVDRRPPTLRVLSAAVFVSNGAGRVIMQGQASDNIGPARLQFRVRALGRPFGKWTTVALRGSGQHRTWKRALRLRGLGAWEVQLRVLDAAGNSSAPVLVPVRA
jgi:uncharacterized repeat protein (TIGR03803 family)